MKLQCWAEQLTIENLRGFRRTVIPLDGEKTFLVGPNNAGKTSILRTLDWIFNGVDEDLLRGRRGLSEQESLLLLPARDSRQRARRLTLRVRIPDGRRARRFGAIEGCVDLRLNVRSGAISLHLGAPTRTEGGKSAPLAVELHRALREHESWIYVPNARDSASREFSTALRQVVAARLRHRILHDARGGAPRAYREAKRAVDAIVRTAENAAEGLVESFASESQSLHHAMELEFTPALADVVDWLAESTVLRLTTGPHDVRKVPVEQVGSGLQSLLSIGLIRSMSGPGAVRLLLEEPESFLHPSAQRELARILLDTKDLKFIASTHSTAMVDEASVENVLLIREHRVFVPALTDQRRLEINSALMTGQGSEAVFARSVLLVEGPGDRAYFEELRRQVSRLPGMSSAASQLAVIQVEGKTRFAPWIRLLNSFVDSVGARAIAWLVLADGDAATEVRQAFREASVTVPEAIGACLPEIKASYDARSIADHESAVTQLNDLSETMSFPLALLPFDLEYAALAHASPNLIRSCCSALGVQAADGLELAYELGSSFKTDRRQAPPKHPWTRRQIAVDGDWSDLHASTASVLRRWLRPVAQPLEPTLPFSG